MPPKRKPTLSNLDTEFRPDYSLAPAPPRAPSGKNNAPNFKNIFPPVEVGPGGSIIVEEEEPHKLGIGDEAPEELGSESEVEREASDDASGSSSPNNMTQKLPSRYQKLERASSIPPRLRTPSPKGDEDMDKYGPKDIVVRRGPDGKGGAAVSGGAAGNKVNSK